MWCRREAKRSPLRAAPAALEARFTRVRRRGAEGAGLRVYVSMIDETLDENGRIVPGLGDAGDRSFGNLR